MITLEELLGRALGQVGLTLVTISIMHTQYTVQYELERLVRACTILS